MAAPARAMATTAMTTRPKPGPPLPPPVIGAALAAGERDPVSSEAVPGTEPGSVTEPDSSAGCAGVPFILSAARVSASAESKESDPEPVTEREPVPATSVGCAGVPCVLSAA